MKTTGAKTNKPLDQDYSESDPLPEIRNLPSVRLFAECFLSDTRQRASLPSLFAECRSKDTRQKKNTWQKASLPRVK